jgi:hypothetical protein
LDSDDIIAIIQNIVAGFGPKKPISPIDLNSTLKQIYRSA